MRQHSVISRPLYKSTRIVLVVLLSALVASCAPTGEPGSENAFEWYANGCVTAAEVAQELYLGADSPLGRQAAEKSLDALVSAGKQVSLSLPENSEAQVGLNQLLETLKSRPRLTDLSESDREKFEKNREAIAGVIGEVGQMCRSVFAGFDTTAQPSPPK